MRDLLKTLAKAKPCTGLCSSTGANDGVVKIIKKSK